MFFGKYKIVAMAHKYPKSVLYIAALVTVDTLLTAYLVFT